MKSDMKHGGSQWNFVDFSDTDEYEIVTTQDLLLMSDKSFALSSEQNNSSGGTYYNKFYSSIKQYEEEWNELYGVQELDLDQLKERSVGGHLRTSHFRSVCWRCLLGILHKQPKEWLWQLQTYRKHYDEVCTELEQNPWNVKDGNPSDNPLSQDSDSVWQKYFCDEELKGVVHQDVKRTFPGMEFFTREEIQQMMVRILFCYARQNPALCYRQGMHEILAPLIFILHCDHQAFLHAKEENPGMDEAMCEILSPEYLEQDAYSIFKFIMNHIECSYRIQNMMTTSTGYFPPDTEKYENKYCQNEVISRLEYIKKNILQPKDPELNDHLQKLDIPLHLFGIRWLRLLFGREFLLQDLLVLWDFIFANSFETVNFIVVAMLIAIRQILLSGDYTDCLSNLMRYPGGVDVTYIIEYALHLKDPQCYPLPDTSRAQSFSQFRATKTKCYPADSVENLGNYSLNNRRLKMGVSRPSQRFPVKSNMLMLGESGDGVGAVVSGYAVDDPNLLRAEIEQTRMIMNIARRKLVQFHTTLTLNLQDANPDVQVVLDGIYELSCLLKNHCRDAHCEIETAHEAGESREPKTQDSGPGRLQMEKAKPPKASINSEQRSHTLPKMKRGPKSRELKVFTHHLGGAMSGGPMTDPLHLIKEVTQDDAGLLGGSCPHD